MEKSEKKLNEVINQKLLLDRLNNIGITTLEELCSCSQKELLEKGIENLYVKDIVIALQCKGIDLRKK